MGPSGSGKSTLLNIISLIDRPTSGSIKFENKLINFNENELKNDLFRANKIGIIYQQDNLLPDFTALENVYFASLSSGKPKDYAVQKAKILLKMLVFQKDLIIIQVNSLVEKNKEFLLARALINEPQIILADEPTGSLDQKSSLEIFNLLRKQINPRRLIIFATHNRFFANKSDCLLEMVDGNIKSKNV